MTLNNSIASANAGIDIFGDSAGIFTFTRTHITNPLNHGIRIQLSSDANINFNDEVTITKNNAGSAINISSNGTLAPLSVTFNGQVTINHTGTGAGIFTNDNGAGTEVSFLGGLDINTVTGRGFSASSGGTISVTGADNTINTTNGLALSIQNTTIGAGGITFSSISSTNSLDKGVELRGNFGAAFTVTGTTMISNPGTIGIDIGINNNAITFGDVNVSNVGRNGIDIDGSNWGVITFGNVDVINSRAGIVIGESVSGGLTFGNVNIVNPSGIGIDFGIDGNLGFVTFGDVDITGLGLGANSRVGLGVIGVDLRGVDVDVTFNTLDIAGTGQALSTGINFSRTTIRGSITTIDSSIITGVGTGIDISNANFFGTYQFGDGEGVIDRDSRIEASIVQINAVGLGTTGTFNFLDIGP